MVEFVQAHLLIVCSCTIASDSQSLIHGFCISCQFDCVAWAYTCSSTYDLQSSCNTCCSVSRLSHTCCYADNGATRKLLSSSASASSSSSSSSGHRYYGYHNYHDQNAAAAAAAASGGDSSAAAAAASSGTQHLSVSMFMAKKAKRCVAK